MEFNRIQFHVLSISSIIMGLLALTSDAVLSSASAQRESMATLQKSGPNAPDVSVLSDDRVATLELDYVEGNPWTPFDIGEDGLGPVGYQITWVPLKRGRTRTVTMRKVTSLRRVQIQPLVNNEPYFVRVDYVNRFGELVGDYSSGNFMGGNEDRVKLLRKQMSGFFDDFNSPAGLPDEMKWNTTFSKTNDPSLQAFFINSQFHSHTLVGTPAFGFGDRGQTVHRVRNPLTMVSGETRRIVFDLDGGNSSGRAIWYLDLLTKETDITSHFALGGGPGNYGHPATGLRFSLIGQEIAVWHLNEAGEQILIEKTPYLDFAGAQTFPNVRRAMEIQLENDHVKMFIDGVSVLDSALGAASLSDGEYTVHWTAFGYNTMKVNMPYYLLHWDNFGFDGPPARHVVHNYRATVAGSDFVRSDNFTPRTLTINIPDDLQPRRLDTAEARLVFTRQMDNWSSAEWNQQDKVTVGGVEFAIPFPLSNAIPPLEITELISANAGFSTVIPLGTVGVGGTSPLVKGLNEITFESARCGFHNVHVEIEYVRGTQPRSYTPPGKLHAVPLHHDFPKVGMPARITQVGDVQVARYVTGLNDPANFNASISGTVNIGMLVNGRRFDSDQTLDSDFVSTQIAASGENPGIKNVSLWIRPDNGDTDSAIRLELIQANSEVPAPQFIGQFEFDTTQFANGAYELTIVAEDNRGVLSIPDYDGAGQQAGTAAALNGFYFPLHVTIGN